MVQQYRRQRMELLIAAYLVIGMAIFALGCQTIEDKPPTFVELLSSTTKNVADAANTLADAADAGIISRESSTYTNLREILLSAQTYIELAWEYYAEGKIADATEARQQAAQAYNIVRAALLRYHDQLEER